MKPNSPNHPSMHPHNSPTRFIPSYTPGQALKTADQAITRNLDETFKIKDSETEQSVIDYFNSMLEKFTDDETDDNIKNNNPKGPPQQTHKKDQVKSLGKDQEFYFEKSSNPSRQEKIQEIALTRGHTSKVQKGKVSEQPQQRKAKENVYVQNPTQKVPAPGQRVKPSSSFTQKNPNSNPSKTGSDRKKSSERTKKPRNDYTIELFKTTTTPSKSHELKRTDSIASNAAIEIKANQKIGSRITLENNTTIEKISSNMATVKGFDSFMMY